MIWPLLIILAALIVALAVVVVVEIRLATTAKWGNDQ